MKEDSTTMFRKICKKTISDFIESANIINSHANISKVFGNLIKMDNYNVYYKNGNKITAINLTDILSARDFNTQKLNSITKITPTIAEDNNIEEAANIMSHYRLRSIPVIEDEEIIGQISIKSIVKSMKDIDIKIPSTKIMTANPIRIHQTDPITTAKNLMNRHRIDHIPIVEDNLKGIVTSFDIAKIILTSDNIDNISYSLHKNSRPLGFPATRIAEKNVTTSSINDSVANVIQLMNSTNSTYSIVTLDDEIQGIITNTDIISLLGQKIDEDIPAYIIGLPDDPFSSELAKTKFNKFIKSLKKSLNDLEEARCRIKLSLRGKTKRYEVDIRIFTTTNKYNYINGGLNLAIIFDQIRDRLKKSIKNDKNKQEDIIFNCY
jgi:CBS domain-containing protein